MQKIIAGLLIVAAIIHLLPVSGVLGSERLAALYGISFQEPNIAILMRHRAVLFSLLGVFLIYAALQPALQPLAIIAGLISAVSFIGIACSVGEYNGAVRRVVIADWIAVTSLCLAGLLGFFARR